MSCPFRVEHELKSMKGAGDLISKTLSSIGIKKKQDCGCGSRQAKLNRLMPFGSAASDRDWSVIVTTAPRPQPTLQCCVDSLRTAGWEPVVFAEPDSPQVDDVETVRNKTRRGVWFNWLHSVEWALKKTKADKILCVQDDTTLHPDSKQFVENILWPSPQTAFLSLYTPKHFSVRRTPGINRVHTGSLWGACAILWPRAVLEQVIRHEVAINWLGAAPRSRNKGVYEKRKANPHLVQNSDTAIGKICNRLRREMWFIDPSPARHIAQHSSVRHGGNTGRRNCGRCADHAASLAEQVPVEGVLQHAIS